MPSRSTIRWFLIPGLSLGVLVLSAALSYWLTRPIVRPEEPARDAIPDSPAPAPEAPPGATPADPSLPELEPPAVAPAPPFPAPRTQLPVLPGAEPGDTRRRVVDVEPVIESTTGRIHTEDVRAAIRAVTPLVQQCFEDAAQRNRGPQQIRLRFTVEGKGAEGQLAAGELLESTIPDPMVQACALDSLLDARFPAPAGGGKATVVYPFEFRALGDAGR